MHTIEQVLDLDAMRAEIADLGEQVAAPDLWDDQDNAHPRHRPALGCSRARSTGSPSSAAGSRTSRSWSSSAARRATPASLAEAETELRQDQEGRRGARGPHPALRRVRRPRGAGHDPLRRRRRRRRRLRRDADADVHPLGRAAQLPGRGLRHLLRRGGRPQVGDLRHPRAVRLRHALGRGRHPPAGADQPVRQPGPPADVVRRGRGRARCSSRPTRSRSPTRTSASTSTAPAARAASRSTPPTPRSGSPTSRPAPWSAARTRSRSCRTRPARWSCSRPSCSR